MKILSSLSLVDIPRITLSLKRSKISATGFRYFKHQALTKDRFNHKNSGNCFQNLPNLPCRIKLSKFVKKRSFQTVQRLSVMFQKTYKSLIYNATFPITPSSKKLKTLPILSETSETKHSKNSLWRMKSKASGK